MAGTINIPLTTLTPGTYHFGPANLADTDTNVLLTIDRTVTGGFSSQPSTTTAAITVEVSLDGGVTWLMNVSAPIGGGADNDRLGVPAATSSVGGSLIPGIGRQARATVTISGGTVAVQGSLVIS